MSQTLKYKDYIGSVEVSIEDKCLHGKLLFVRDLVTYQASNIDELEKEFQFAVDDYLETCAELGIEAKKPLCGTFNVRIGPNLHEKLAYKAATEGTTQNELVKIAVQAFVEINNERVIHHHHHHHSSIEYKQNFNSDEIKAKEITDERHIHLSKITVGETEAITH